MTKKQALKKQDEYLKSILTEKGYKECIAKLVTLSPEYFRNGGTFNCMDYEQKDRLIN